ncbi:arginine deiminase [Bacillus sp. 165]|uniref:arginine deiminase n=1 Tax=Bacillus sp. 165 TaxID=1529117 RepID=UPI001ADCE03F|nr:arginine deiminase [Bacillus sp. 165]MBO9131313.1 arginine deiminase [Bacillus sp. 165]
MPNALQIYSEIGVLNTVLLKRPGMEVENLTPDYLAKLLFDDIPYLPAMQKEHDYFSSLLCSRGIETLYVENLLIDILKTHQIKVQFVNEFLQESGTFSLHVLEQLKEYLLTLSTEAMIEKMMSGVRKNEINKHHTIHLYEMLEDSYPFYLDPMPNLYFTRDPAAAIGNGISINKMNKKARQRESIFIQYIVKYHPRFSSSIPPLWFERNNPFSIEGGDQLILNDTTIAVGISERTTPHAIEAFATNLFRAENTFNKILAVDLPKHRSFMHLDTVLTMIDHDKFTVHPSILNKDGEINIYILHRNDSREYFRIEKRTKLLDTLKEALKIKDLTLIPCGGGDPIAAAREQWNDGSNTLAIAPGVVVAYDRNYVSNKLLRSYGVEVIEVLSSELARGRGGPRCMTMPLNREIL